MKPTLRIKLVEKPVETSKSTNWRHNVREEKPEHYEALKKKDAERKRIEYSALKERRSQGDRDARAKIKEKTERQRETQRRYRERVKQRKAEAARIMQSSEEPVAESSASSEPSHLKATPVISSTSKASSSKGKSRAKYMVEYRAKFSHQKKNKLKALERKRKAPCPDEPPSSSQNIRRKQPKRKLDSSLPQTPERYAKHMKVLIDEATPKKKEALKKHDIIPDQKQRKVSSVLLSGVKDMYSSTKKCSKDAAKLSSSMHSAIIQKLRKSRLCSAASKVLRFNRKLTYRRRLLKRKVRADVVPLETKTKVVQFLCSSAISTERPEVRFKGKRLMMMSALQAFNLFHKTHPGTRLGYSTFLKLFPKYLLPFKKYHFNCKCTYCNNIEILLKSINRHMGRVDSLTQPMKLRMKALTVYDLQEIIMCDKGSGSKFFNTECIQKKCENCSNTQEILECHYQDLLRINSPALLKWERWERSLVKVNIRKDGEFVVEEKKRLVLNAKQGTFRDALQSLVEMWEKPCQGIDMRNHLMNASWEDAQFEQCKKMITSSTAVVVYDFARNFATLHQDEVKSSAFAKHQITIHPVPMYYIDPDSGELVRETLVISSDDITHDVAAVSSFRKTVIKHLKVTRSVPLQHLYEWSDGCESQYKGVYAFKQIVVDVVDAGIQITASFFGSEHGKGESDGETGVVKSQLTSFILGESGLIKCAEDIKKFGDQKLSAPSEAFFKHLGRVIRTKRTFTVVNQIQRRRREVDLYSIAGTRVRLHCISTVGSTDKLLTRNLACFCRQCLRADGSRCSNTLYAGPWKMELFKPKKPKKSKKSQFASGVKKQNPTSGILRQQKKRKGVQLQKSQTGPARQNVSPCVAGSSSSKSNSKKNMTFKAMTNAAAAEKEDFEVVSRLKSNDKKEVRVGDWVIVDYFRTMYPGEVIEIVPAGFKVNCMHPTPGVQGQWKWPSQVDNETIYAEIVKIIDLPQPVLMGSRRTGEHGSFNFNEPLLQ